MTQCAVTCVLALHAPKKDAPLDVAIGVVLLFDGMIIVVTDGNNTGLVVRDNGHKIVTLGKGLERVTGARITWFEIGKRKV